MSEPARPIYELEVTAVGPLAEEFTAHGVWVFFNETAPDEVAEFALLHRAAAPRGRIAPGHVLEIDSERFAICAVGDVANTNIATLGHLVLKANGATEPEMPGDVCIEARQLPQPNVGMVVRIWGAEGEDTDGPL